ncbi:MAG: FxSxx-COOH system tetratricopeptide repeat protein, partial [candidate division WOR-3 bacterium]|nr:FxSxx-COOH system tetratricopeptide repeat protein [candidate division WOR-3 bacterium]
MEPVPLVHFLGHYYDAGVFWGIAATAAACVVGIVVAYILYKRSPSKDVEAAVAEVNGKVAKLHEVLKQQPPVQVPAVAPAGLVWNVPFDRNRSFTGREEMLTRLRQELVGGKDVALTQKAAVHGLGGIGKTQLAVEYCFRHVHDYDIIWWVRADTPESQAGDFAQLGPHIGIPSQQEQAQTVELVKQALNSRDNWLLVFDNVQQPADIDLCLPNCGKGHVIITSRHSDWANKAEEFRVEVLPEPEAVVFLLRRTGREDKAGALELAKALGCLPLALEQAGAFARESGMSFADYLALYRERRQELLKHGKPEKYDDTVLTTWDISFRKAGEESDAATELLAVCAYLDADDIPAVMLADATEDKVKHAEAVAALTRYSLLTSRQEGEGETARTLISLHRLVQEVVQDRMTGKERKAAVGTAVAIVNQAFPAKPSDVRNWPECVRLLPHATNVLKHSERLRVEPEGTTRLLNQVALYLHARAEHASAEPLMKRALAMDEKSYGPDHPDVARDLNNLAALYQATNRLAEAEPLMKRALAIDEMSYGPEHPEVATDLNNLAQLYQATNRLAEAEPLMKRALAMDEKSYGPDHPNVAIRLNNL